MAIESTRATRVGITPVDSLDEFLDLAGHELRSPITALKGHVQLLQRRMRRQGDRETDLAELNKVMYQIERINHELDVYLEASHVTRKRFSLQLGECDLVALVQRIVDSFASGDTAHKIRLETELGHLVSHWDRRRLHISVSALLTNAVKYSLDGEVVVRVTREGERARVEISDQGIGVPPSERRAIFNAYVRGSNAENAGAGLGLFVTQQTIKLHGGRCGVKAHPGGGSVFWFTLPLVPQVR